MGPHGCYDFTGLCGAKGLVVPVVPMALMVAIPTTPMNPMPMPRNDRLALMAPMALMIKYVH